MPVFRDANKLAAHIENALGALQRETLITTQARLSSTAVSPIQTGRLRSSWFAAEGGPSGDVAPKGANSPQTNASGLQMDPRKEYHLTNNLPYAQAVALDGKVVSKPSDWFTSFVNTEVPRIQAKAAQVVKKRFEL